jgi:N utilization substance protein B
MSPGWQINKSPEPDVKVVEQVEASAEAVAESPVEPTVEVPAREIVSHVVGGTATALDTQRRLVRVNAEDAKKGRAKSARASAAAKKSAVAKTASVAPTVAVAKKAGTRRKGREMAMQMLFQADIGKQTAEQVRNSFWNAAEKVDPDTRGFAEDLFRIATTREEEIDTLIEAHSANWRLPRMAAVDRNLLRAATAEFLGFPGTPVPIVINESLEIARRYSAPESINFLNGVLDAISRSRT